MEQKDKFRIMVIERNDGTKMYHPQVYTPVDVRYKVRLFGFDKIVSSESLLFGFGKLVSSELIYEWRSFRYTADGIVTCDRAIEHGNGSNEIKDAHEMIEKYKLDLVKRIEKRKSDEMKENNKKAKSITYIEAS